MLFRSVSQSRYATAYLGEKDTVCSDETTVTTPWIDGDSCDLAQDTYEITLMDTECGETRLEELQKAYPELSISIGASTQKSVFLFAGTSGDGNISIDGVNYAITFASNITTTITNFVTAHGATLAGLGITVTVVGSNKLSFVAPSTVNITYTQTTADLSATNVVSPIQDREACSTRYVAVVGTNICFGC